MQTPVDYPIDDAARTAQFSMDELMYAALLDRMSSPMATESQPDPAHNLLQFDVEPAPQLEQTRVPQPLATIAQTLLAGERASAAAGVLSRWTRASR